MSVCVYMYVQMHTTNDTVHSELLADSRVYLHGYAIKPSTMFLSDDHHVSITEPSYISRDHHVSVT